jgi:GTP-binding protein
LAEFKGQITVQLFSSLKKTGMDEAEKVVGSWLTEDGEAALLGEVAE